MARGSEINCCDVFSCRVATPNGRCLAKTGATIALALGIIVVLAGILGVLGAYNVFPPDLAWLGYAGANGLEYAIIASVFGACLAATSAWLLKAEPWRR